MQKAWKISPCTCKGLQQQGICTPCHASVVTASAADCAHMIALSTRVQRLQLCKAQAQASMQQLLEYMAVPENMCSFLIQIEHSLLIRRLSNQGVSATATSMPLLMLSQPLSLLHLTRLLTVLNQQHSQAQPRCPHCCSCKPWQMLMQSHLRANSNAVLQGLLLAAPN